MNNSGLADSPFFPIKKRKEIQKPRNHDTVVSSNHDTIISSINEGIQEIGRVAATYRLTKWEKEHLQDLIYHFRKESVKVSENSLIRISINYIINDHEVSKKRSIISRILLK